ncbi:UDP-2,3-diacylglucosamine diphosphatase [Varunaivibrio sulfuroxidans]|uniref:UDP-2,3-diacylglucosamine pyrophosphatase LpxH n=1 Tax=Varunaivibrio sulfuroxidans TaxID=1773489 RepID=A0A4R3JAR5_9PROT|nr:UDP-2,3-diacylglucosamine diphosphatase [Varunaivibrio sulfuroxidans]TCS62113.1 UDP-2,3-diacylglucosamine pyrophosphatase LpxH [Varunaivibrio sulfuroxidans]WES30546.1 UDP-2,3-diacylglucosamine diphosphatase [Varunaivibrio sulfuroxidans]
MHGPIPTPQATFPVKKYRTIWISDIHLGTRGCQAEMLLDFLKHTESDVLYLVGDIIDGWRMKRSWYWCQSHNDVVQKLLRKARKGTRIIYVPGNHDENFRDFTNHNFGSVSVVNEAIHVAADGKRYLVLHGDQFDGVVKFAKWLAYLGDSAYTAALAVNHWFNVARRRLGFPYWSLSAFLKKKVKNAVEYVSRYEDAVAAAARARNVDGVICGHIHCAEKRPMGDVIYCNTGDWVESCTALVEDDKGHIDILHWSDVRDLSIMGEHTACASSLSRTPGFLKSMVSFARSTRSGTG